MARVTVEDCVGNIQNRFELVMVAAKRARQLERTGIEPYVEWENDKPTVVALREIADGHITSEILQASEDIEESVLEEAMAAEPSQLDD